MLPVKLRIHFDNQEVSEYYVDKADVSKFIQSVKNLHTGDCINPHNGNSTARAVKVEKYFPVYTGPYWWTTPNLKNNDDPEGVTLITWDELHEVVTLE